MTECNRGLACILFLLAAAAVPLLSGCAGSAPVDTRPELIRSADTAISQGVDQYNRSDYARAAAAFERALHGYRAVDDPEGIAASSLNLAKTRLAQGEREAAGRWLDAAQNIIDSNGLQHLAPRVTIIRSSIAIENRRTAAAREMLEPILTADPGSVEPDALLAALQNRTRIAFLENEETDRWTERYADRSGPDTPLHHARVARFRAALADEDSAADTYYAIALERYRDIAYRPGIAAALFEWSDALLRRGEYDAAADRLSRALFIRSTMADAAAASTILGRLAEVYRESGNEKAAAQTRAWIERVNTEGFSDWPALTQSYSAFPAR